MRPFEPLPGLVKGLNVKSLPRSGYAFDLGSGEGRNLSALYGRFPTSTTAFESYRPIVDYVLGPKLQELGLKGVSINTTNVLLVDFGRNNAAITVVDMLFYLPKPKVVELLNKLWVSLKVNGVLCAAFATHENGIKQVGMADFDCVENPAGSGSFWHMCASTYCHHVAEGRMGASFWHEVEAIRTLSALGRYIPIHFELLEWNESYGGPSGGTVRQSFYVFTVQKKG